MVADTRNKELTHFDDAGRARMVDVTDKAVSSRRAKATGSIRMSAEAMTLIRDGGARKGDVLTVSQLAGIMAVKKTADLIPLCHPLPVSSVKAVLTVDENLPGVLVTVEVKTTGQTGVEMEALTGVSVACLTVYDMVKAVDKEMIIGPIQLEEKSGGKSGYFQRGQ